MPLTVETMPYQFEDAAIALRDLAGDRVTGAAVVCMRETG
jgi:hypothetical protein